MYERATPTVLVADDDDEIREFVCVVLRQAGLEPWAVPTGDEALDAARSQDWRMAVLDVNMPGLTGVEICRELKGGERARMPILLMSGDCAPQEVAAGYAAGADYFLPKPFGRQHLLRRVTELLSAGAPA